jgi:hypothetical protein
MRGLTVKQKKLLKRWYIESGYREIFEGRFHYKFTVEDLTDAQWDILMKINDTEVLHQNIDRFLNDLKEEDL